MFPSSLPVGTSSVVSSGRFLRAKGKLGLPEPSKSSLLKEAPLSKPSRLGSFSSRPSKSLTSWSAIGPTGSPSATSPSTGTSGATSNAEPGPSGAGSSCFKPSAAAEASADFFLTSPCSPLALSSAILLSAAFLISGSLCLANTVKSLPRRSESLISFRIASLAALLSLAAFSFTTFSALSTAS